jgi:hypothetical protein
MKNITMAIFAVVLILGGVFIIASKDGGTAIDSGSTSVVTVDSTMHDFGDIDIFGGKVEKDFLVTNEGPDEVVILAGTTSCGCTDGSIDGVSFGMHVGMSREVTLAPGESKTLTAIYDPLAHGPDGVGQVTRQLFLKTNSVENPELEVRVMANVMKMDN